jgi:hypothetical protein
MLSYLLSLEIVSTRASSPQRSPLSNLAASPQTSSSSKHALDSPQRPLGVKKRKIAEMESSISKARIAQTFVHALSEKDAWGRLPGILTNFEKRCPSCHIRKQTCSRNCLVRQVLPRVRPQLKFQPYTCCFFCFLPDCDKRRNCETPNTLGIALAMLLSCRDVTSKHFSSTLPLLQEEEEDIGALAAWLCAVETGNKIANVTRVALLAVRLRHFE